MTRNCRSGWGFYHHANLNCLIKSFTFELKFLFVDFDLFLQCTHFFNRDDHREHDAQFTESGSAQDGTNLVAQNLFAIHGDAHCAPAEERVLFFREVHVRQLFVAADVHGANDNRLRAARFGNGFVCCELFFFSRQRVAVHEQEFCTIQTNAFRAVTFGTFNVAYGTDVGADFNLMAVQRNGRQVFQLSQFRFLFSDLSLQVAQFFDLLIARVNQNLIIHRVENQIIAVFHLASYATGAHDGRQFKGTRHDRGMGSTTARVGDETQHLVQVQLCGFRRGEVSGYQDNFILNRAQIDDGQTEDVAQQALTDVAYVSGTLFQVFVIQFFQGSSLTFDNFIGCRIGSHMLIFNQGYDFLLKLLIFQQHDVPFEDGFFFFTEGFTSFGFDDLQLGGGLGAAIQKTFNFLINLIGRNFLPVDDNFIFFQQKCLAESDTRGC